MYDYNLVKVDYEVQHTPFTDSLTGLFNHGFFQVALSREMKRSHRYQEPFSLALIDIDGFSTYNKRKGPLGGDRALMQIADIMRDNTREVDLIARYGGDVFSLLMQKTPEDQGITAVQRVRDAIHASFDNVLTVSIGVASYPEAGTNKTDLLSNAHEALRNAKQRRKGDIYYFDRRKEHVSAAGSTVLVVDDNALNIKMLEGMLIPLKYNVIRAMNGFDALSIINRGEIDIVLLDIMMPEMDGIEVCRRIKSQETTRMIPVVMVTALDESDAKIRAIEAGADDFLTKPPGKVELKARVKSLLNVKRLNENLVGIENALISLANAVEAKDRYTEGHVQRVSSLAVQMGKRMYLTEREVEALRIGGILHDIGKIGIPDAILNKEGSLDPGEREIMMSHPVIGFNMAQPLKKNLHQALDIIRYHHEKLDGSGYPDGLKGEEISTTARIMAVVDAFDALTSDRPYRRALSVETGLRILKEEAAGGKMDGAIVEQLEAMLSHA